jgi:hypothetical protein
MKKLVTHLVGVVFLATAAAQNGAPKPEAHFKGIHPKPQRRITKPTHKPIVLFTGKPITPADKAKFLASAKEEFKRKTPAKPNANGKQNANGKENSAPVNSSTTLLSPEKLYVPNVVDVVANGAFIDEQWGALGFTPGSQSQLQFEISANASKVYLLHVKVNLNECPSSQTGQITVLNGLSQTQTTAPQFADNEFLVAIDSSDGPDPEVAVFTSCYWSFLSAELDAYPGTN